jgi:TPR repeat protein
MYFYGCGNAAINPLVGLIYLQRVAGLENPTALQILGDIYYYSNNVNKNHKKAKELHKSSSSQLSGEKCFRIWKRYYIGSKNFTKYHEIAFIYLNAFITKGYRLTALRYFGIMYYEGENVEKNHEKAIWYYKDSAGFLTREMNYRIGLEYFNGSNQSKKNIEAGLIHINESIDQGSSIATRFIADKYYYGDNDIEKDQAKALKLHKTSATRSYHSSNFELGKEYYYWSYLSQHSSLRSKFSSSFTIFG